MGRKKLSSADVQKVRQLREEGYTIKAVAAELGVVHTTLRRFMREHHLSTRPSALRVRFTPEQLEDIQQCYEAGETLTSLKRRYGCDVQTIRKQLMELGVPLRQQWNRHPEGSKAHQLDVQQLVELYQQGETLEQLAKRFQVAVATVRSRLYEAGVELRSRGPTPKSERERLDTRLKRLYGISVGDYETMLEQQDEKCAICQVPANDARNHGRESLCIDHCHETSCVRGLLCHTCNMGLSYFLDSPDLMSRGSAYLAQARRS